MSNKKDNNVTYVLLQIRKKRYKDNRQTTKTSRQIVSKQNNFKCLGQHI